MKCKRMIVTRRKEINRGGTRKMVKKRETEKRNNGGRKRSDVDGKGGLRNERLVLKKR